MCDGWAAFVQRFWLPTRSERKMFNEFDRGEWMGEFAWVNASFVTSPNASANASAKVTLDCARINFSTYPPLPAILGSSGPHGNTEKSCWCKPKIEQKAFVKKVRA